MSYDPITSQNNPNKSSQDDVMAPGSPYLDLLNQSFSTNNELDLEISSPTPSHSSLPAGQQQYLQQQQAPKKSRIVNALLKRGSKDTLKTDSRSSPSITSSPVLSKAQSSLYQNNSAAGSTSSASSSQPKSILKKNQANNILPPKPPTTQNYSASAIPPRPNNTPNEFNNNYNSISSDNNTINSNIDNSINSNNTTINNSNNNNNNNYNVSGFQSTYAGQRPISGSIIAGLVPPASPLANSYNGSSGGENSPNSFQRFRKNPSPLGDNEYNMTQSNMTLEGLAQRWNSYQALMKKRYAEVPFYRRWTKSKWMLLFSAILLLGYSIAILVVSIGYMTDRIEHSPVVMEIHSNMIYLAFAGGLLGIVSALIGLFGTIRENRIWLSIYTTILWPVFGLFVSVGYIAFRRAHNHLRAHVKDEWVREYTREQRLTIQRNLKCCGFQSSAWYAEYDLRCFPMTVLPGCYFKYTRFEESFLESVWVIAFSIVPVQLFVMIAALLCSNHVDGMFRSARPGLKSFKEEKNE